MFQILLISWLCLLALTRCTDTLQWVVHMLQTPCCQSDKHQLHLCTIHTCNMWLGWSLCCLALLMSLSSVSCRPCTTNLQKAAHFVPHTQWKLFTDSPFCLQECIVKRALPRLPKVALDCIFCCTQGQQQWSDHVNSCSQNCKLSPPRLQTTSLTLQTTYNKLQTTKKTNKQQ